MVNPSLKVKTRADVRMATLQCNGAALKLTKV
jgi:hypothetical protein